MKKFTLLIGVISLFFNDNLLAKQDGLTPEDLEINKCLPKTSLKDLSLEAFKTKLDIIFANNLLNNTPNLWEQLRRFANQNGQQEINQDEQNYYIYPWYHWEY